MKRLFALALLLLISFSVANAGLISLTEDSKEKIDAVFPELIYNTADCLTDCSAQFKYCLDGDADYELNFNIPEVTSYGYYTTETHKETDYNKCLNEETLTHKCTAEEIADASKNSTECKDYDYTNCKEYDEKDVSAEVWNEGLPSEKAGCYEVTIYGHKKATENVDWQPTLVKKGFLWDTEYTQKDWAWWNTSFNYYRTITDLTGNFTYLNLTYSANMYPTFADIFFVQNDVTTLNATLEDKVDSLWATFRIFTPTQSDIKIYYGNTSAIGSNSNASATHLMAVGVYYMDEASGTVLSDATNTNNGTNNLALVNQAGKINKGYKFDGVDDYANITGMETTLNASKAVSISVWFNADSFIADSTLIGDGWTSGGSSNYQLRFHSNTQLQVAGDSGICAGGWWTDIDGGTTFATGTWTHLVLIVNTTGKWMYINGVFKGQENCGGANPGYYKIGDTETMIAMRRYGSSSADANFNGTIDSVMFFNKTLSPTEIYELYTYTAPTYTLGTETSGDSIVYTTQSPANNTVINNTNTIHFNATPLSTGSATMSCNLSINGTLNQTNATVYNNTLTDFTVALPFGYWNWTMNCWNGSTSNSTTFGLTTQNTEIIGISAPSPANNTVLNNTLAFNYNFTPTWNVLTPNCTLKLNGTLVGYNSTPYNNTLTNFALTGLSYSYYNTTINCTNSLNSTQTINFLTTNAVDIITFVSQTPADINTTNILNNPLTIIYNITNSSAINYSQVYIYTKTNTTTHDWYALINGTTEAVPEQRLQTSNAYPNVSFVMYDNAMYPHTENIQHTYFRNTVHTNTVSLTNANQYYSTTYFNVSNATQYGFYEQMLNSTSSTPARFYVCNSTYAFGNSPSGNANCVQFATKSVNGNYEHCHNQYGANDSCHFTETFAINTTSGTINGLRISTTMHFIVRGNTGQTIMFWGVTNVTRNGQTRLSTNSGNAWTNQTFTDDGHLHQYDGTERFWYFASFNAGLTNSTLRSESIDLDTQPPNAVNVYSPTGTNYSGTININYTSATSPTGQAISFYNITLRNSDLSYNSTIAGNNSLNLSKAWNSIGTPDGLYIIGVNATDNLSKTSLGYSEEFQIDNTAPTTTATAIGNTTSMPYTWGSTSTEGLVITLTCSDVNGCNVTRYCIDATDSCSPNTTYTSPINYNTNGTSYIRYSSNDSVGNNESTNTNTIIITYFGTPVLYYYTTNVTGDTYTATAYPTLNYGTLPSMNVRTNNAIENMSYIWLDATSIFASGKKIYSIYLEYNIANLSDAIPTSSFISYCSSGLNFTAQNETTLTSTNQATICAGYSDMNAIPNVAGAYSQQLDNVLNTSNKKTVIQFWHEVNGPPQISYFNIFTKEYSVYSKTPKLIGLYAGNGNIFVNNAKDSLTNSIVLSNVTYTNTSNTVSWNGIGTTSIGVGSFSYVTANQMTGLVTTTVIDNLGAYYPAHFYNMLYNSSAPVEIYPILVNKSGLNIGFPTFYVVNPAGYPVANAVLSVYQNIGGTWTLAQQGLTDSSGAVSLYLYNNVRYQVTATDGTTTSSVYTITPTLGSYTIILGTSGVPDVPNLFDTVTWSITPTMYQIPFSNSTPVTFKTFDSASGLTLTKMWLYYGNGTLITSPSSASSNGATLSANIKTAVPNNSLIIGVFEIDKTGFAQYNISRNFLVMHYANYTFSLSNVLHSFESTPSISAGWKQIIVIGFCLGIAIVTFRWIGDIGALFVGALLFTICSYFGLLGWMISVLIWMLLIGYIFVKGGFV